MQGAGRSKRWNVGIRNSSETLAVHGVDGAEGSSDFGRAAAEYEAGVAAAAVVGVAADVGMPLFRHCSVWGNVEALEERSGNSVCGDQNTGTKEW